MSNETKRDVFERALDEWYSLVFAVGNQGEEAYGYCEFDETLSKYEKDYDAALPDDLPVIPEAVGEYIQWCKSYDGIHSISEALYYATESNREWIYRAKNSDTFALAWLLGVWRVEETGEIVKLEEEK